MDEAGGDEQPGRAMQEPPALVPAEDAAHVAHQRRIARGEDERRETVAGTTDCQRGRIAHTASATSPIAPIAPSGPPSAVPSGLDDKQDVRSQQDEAGDRNAAVPDRSPVDPVEPLLDPRQRADQHEADREEQDRLGPEELTQIGAARLVWRPDDGPQDSEPDHEETDRRRADLTRDESFTHSRLRRSSTSGSSGVGIREVVIVRPKVTAREATPIFRFVAHRPRGIVAVSSSG